MEIHLACIVEGHGDGEAVPVLVRRIAGEVDPAITVRIPAAIRTPKSRLVKPAELERAVELAARKIASAGGVFVLLDSDDDCPAEWGRVLLSRATKARSDVPIAVVLAKREFEAWFLPAAESLRGHRGLPDDLQPPPDPETVRGAKEWLGDRMLHASGYSPALDQAAFAAVFDLELARRSDSFDKCYRDIASLILRMAGSS